MLGHQQPQKRGRGEEERGGASVLVLRIRVTNSRDLLTMSKKGELSGWKMIVLIEDFGEFSVNYSVEETVRWMRCDFLDYLPKRLSIVSLCS